MAFQFLIPFLEVIVINGLVLVLNNNKSLWLVGIERLQSGRAELLLSLKESSGMASAVDRMVGDLDGRFRNLSTGKDEC